MVSDRSAWVQEPLKSILASLNVSCEVLIAMTIVERVAFWKKYQYGDEVGALAEQAVCDAPDELKDPSSLRSLRGRVDLALNAELPENYTPLEVDITVTEDEEKPAVDSTTVTVSPAPKASSAPSYTPYTAQKSDLEQQFVGLINQGGTCYLNSTVQALFHIPKFREIIYNIRVDSSVSSDFASITTALQNLFMALQTKKSSISTVELTQSFGWNVSDAHEQHDAHEMIQRLLEAFEMITKDTPIKDELHSLFHGKMLNYVRCLDTDYVSRNPAEFFDLELLTLNNEDMSKSLDAKVRPEKLDGEYKREYEDGRPPTKHPAEMGSVFLSLPPVLFVHPSRVDFCMTTFQRKMVETEWKFDKKLNFSRYVAKDPESGVEVINDGTGEDDPSLDYELLSVIMHQGTPFAGHYMAYTRYDDKWLKFNDSSVSEVSEQSVLNDAFSSPSTSTDYWGSSRVLPAYTRASVLVYIKSSMKDALVFPITEANLPDTLHENLRRKAEREEVAKREAEVKARLVTVRYIVADKKGEYLTKLGIFFGRDGPLEKVEMDKDVSGRELGELIAAEAHIDSEDIQELWEYPTYYYPNSSYSAPKPVSHSATAGDCAKSWVLVQLKGSSPAALKVVLNGEDEAPMEKQDTQQMEARVSTDVDYTSLIDAPAENIAPRPDANPYYSETRGVFPLCVYKRGSIEYLGISSSLAEVAKLLEGMACELLTEEQLEATLASKRERMRPHIRPRRYDVVNDDDLYTGLTPPSSLTEREEVEEDVTLTFEDKLSYCCVEKGELKNCLLNKAVSGTILVAFPSVLPTNTISIAYDRLCNPLSVTVFQLDDALTPEELCELVICPSYTYDKLQEVVFEAMQGKSVPLLAPIRRMPASEQQIGFRCHDDKTDRPHKKMQLTNKYVYGEDKHTAQSILSNKSMYMITKLYVEVLPKVISIPELDGHGRVCDIPLHLGYFYHRHFYMKEGRNILLFEVFRIAMAQQLDSLPAEFRDRVEQRWTHSKKLYLENLEATRADAMVDIITKKSTFDPVFRLVRLTYAGNGIYSEHYDWSEQVTLDNYYDYVVDLLPDSITSVNWTKYVKVDPQVKPFFHSQTETISMSTPAPSSSCDEVIVKDHEGHATETSKVADDKGSDKDGPEVTVPSTADAAFETADGAVDDKQTVVAGDEAAAVNTTQPSTSHSPPTPVLMIEGPKDNHALAQSDRVNTTSSIYIPGEEAISWYLLYHGDRRYTDAIYGLATTVILPLDASHTGAELLEMILKQIGVVPEDDRTFPDAADATSNASAASSPAVASPPNGKNMDVYQTAKKTWKLVFKGKATKVLEPNAAYSTIAADVGQVEYIMLDHPQSTKARVIPRNQRAEQAIRIGIISSETDKMKQKHEEEAATHRKVASP